MPLSEHEQRELEQIERYLAAEDPKFVNSIRSISPRTRYKRRIALAVPGFLLGIALLLAGVAKAIPLSIVGFAVMTLSVLWAISSWRHLHDADQPGGSDPPSPHGAELAGAGGPSATGAQDADIASLDRAREQARRAAKREKKRQRKSGKSGKSGWARSTGGATGGGSSRGRRSGGFMDRIEQRWRRRRDNRWY